MKKILLLPPITISYYLLQFITARGAFAQGLLDKINIQDAQNNIAPKIKLGNITDLLTGGFPLLNLIFFIIGLIFFVNLISAAWSYILSQGDAKKAAAGNTKLLNAIIGLIVVFASFVIVRVVASVLGLESLI